MKEYIAVRETDEESIGWRKEVRRPVEGSSFMNTTDDIDRTLTPLANEGSRLKIISKYTVGTFAQMLHLPIVVRRVGCLIRDFPESLGKNILCVVQFPQGQVFVSSPHPQSD